MKITSLGHASFHIRTKGLSVLVDPWLTDRLDRFWTHWPPLDGLPSIEAVDLIIISHHHCDHLHIDSLRMLPRSATVLYPAAEARPEYAGSGMGYKAIPWVLRELGFQKISAMSPFDRVRICDTDILPLPSRVFFPEFMYVISSECRRAVFGGDSQLHPKTVDYWSAHNPKIDVAFIPCHSTSPTGPLLQRKASSNYDLFRARARTTFLEHVELVNAGLTIPSSFGWRVQSLDASDHFDWANSHLFPLTPGEADELLTETGIRSRLLAPGDVVNLAQPGAPIVEISRGRSQMELRDADRAVRLNTRIPIPAFAPGSYGEPQPHMSCREMAQYLMDDAVGSYYWQRMCQSGLTCTLRLTAGHAVDQSFELDFRRHRLRVRLAPAANEGSYTWMHPGTLSQLITGNLAFPNSFGLWCSNDNILTAVFHHPKYYVLSLRKSSVQPATVSNAAEDAPHAA